MMINTDRTKTHGGAERFADTKVVIRSCQLKNDRQCNGQKTKRQKEQMWSSMCSKSYVFWRPITFTRMQLCYHWMYCLLLMYWNKANY